MTGRSWRQPDRRIPLAALATILAVVTGCSAAGDVQTDGGGSTSMAMSSDERSSDASNPSAASGSSDVTVEQLLDDPLAWVDRPVRVEGRVFFLSRCPPPGDLGATGCVLTGYLTDPATAVFTASDVGRGILLAEGGQALSCAEGSRPTPTCGDWAAGAVYRLSGHLARQVLGGRTSDDVQLEVQAKDPVGP